VKLFCGKLKVDSAEFVAENEMNVVGLSSTLDCDVSRSATKTLFANV